MPKRYRKNYKRKMKRNKKRPNALFVKRTAQGFGTQKPPPSMLIYKGVGNTFLPPKFRFKCRANWAGSILPASYTAANGYFTKAYCSAMIAFTPFDMPLTALPVAGGPSNIWSPQTLYPADTANRSNGFANLVNANCYQSYRVLSSKCTVRCIPSLPSDNVMVMVAPVCQLQGGNTIANNEPGYLFNRTMEQGPRTKKKFCSFSHENVITNEINMWDMSGVTKENWLNDNSAQKGWNTRPGGAGTAAFPTGIYESYWLIGATLPDNIVSGNPLGIVIDIDFYVQAEDLQLVSILD